MELRTKQPLGRIIMEFFDVLKQRHSIRAFQPIPIEADKLNQLLQAINRAPSAGNRQAYEVYLVQDTAHKNALVSAANGQEFLAQAPVVLVFCTHPALNAERYGKRGEKLYAVQDATIACTFAMLAATALGLSSVWVGAFNDEAVSQVLGDPEGQHPVAILPIGYAAEEPRLRDRRPLDELVHWV
jgi:nitroreductase